MNAETQHIHWTASLSTELQSVDEQHQKIIESANTALDALQGDDGLAAAIPHIETLIAETRAHFAHEEQLMRNIAFPAYPEHKVQHDRLLEEITDYMLELDLEQSAEELQVLINFLKFWVVRHMSQSDTQIRDFILRPEHDLQTNAWKNHIPEAP
ncbi:bacteriohemerythrin [Magnetospira sp. QH-2]|uniref:bacteriohemerythrin n=1 Tax=Magnetospira sp. (strain QH-2) TaxID=1288970 RepID=UPI0003E80F2C|nr:hemerythrin family protein [Magnetospira sp. QH-2]CCQ75350.1 putative hemerythrin-like metal-binding protein [Magnetospira sp. QH-2]